MEIAGVLSKMKFMQFFCTCFVASSMMPLAMALLGNFPFCQRAAAISKRGASQAQKMKTKKKALK